ncbi:hypothetical protein A5906_26195 [Bradyrhizobium sacchari]|nr:hypothetical protein A5906_26195 [Bradyrhizobium sacchari]
MFRTTGRVNGLSEMKSSIDGSSGVDFHEWYGKNGLAWGAGDMFVVAGGNPSTRIAEILAILASSYTEDGQPVFSEIIVVQPPGSAGPEERKSALFHHLGEAVVRSRGTALETAELDVLSRRINIAVSPDLQVASVCSIVEAAKQHAAVVVDQGALYRGVEPGPYGARPVLGMVEDSWVPHFAALCEGAVLAARASTSYVAVDANKDWPLKEANQERLLAIDGMAVLAGGDPDAPDAILAQHLAKWSTAIARGVIGPILAEIDTLPSSLDGIKPLLKVQMMHKAGLQPMVEQALRAELGLIENLAPVPALQVAEMAAEAGATDIARNLVQKIAFDRLPLESIEAALTLSKRIGEPGTIQKCEEILQERHPTSLALMHHRGDAMLEAGEFIQLARLLVTSPVEDDRRMAGFYETLAAGLASSELDYQVLTRAVIAAHPRQTVRARVFIAREAIRAQRYAEALSVITEDAETDVTASMVTAMLKALEGAVLGGDKAADIEPQLLQAAVLLGLRYLTSHPADARVRVRLVDALSAESMGLFGIALLVDTALKLASAPLALREIEALDAWTTAPPADDIAAFLRVALPWLQSASPVFVGRIDIPKELLTQDADKLVAGIRKLLEHYEPLDTPADIENVRNILAIGMAVARHGSVPDADLSLVRVLAVRLALASRFQAARDYAEHALQVAGESKARSRLAWLCYGDVYQRTGNTIDGMVGALCCLAADNSALPDQVFYESVLLYRLMRDLRMIDAGLSFLDAARKALQSFGARDQYVHRIQTLELQARFIQARQDPADARERLEALIPDFIQNARTVLTQGDEPAPAAASMAEALRAAELAGVTPPPAAIEAFERLLDEAHAPLRGIIAASRLPHPTTAQVLEVLKQIEQARDANDVGYDVRQISVLARRLLGSAEAQTNLDIAAFAIDILADHAIPSLGVAPDQGWIPPTIESSGERAVELSRSMQLPVVLMGVDAEGHLVRCVAENGKLGPTLKESAEVFSEERLRRWSREFPFRYGVDEDALNLFHTSTEGLGVEALPPRAILVTAANIQHWPPNLIRLGGGFAGQTCKLAAAPSLPWLSAARHRKSTDRRAIAWIPKEASDEGGQTLQTVVDRVSEPLAAHGVSLDTASVVPSNLEGAELVIVTAHGGLVPGNRYFQVVRDDAELRMAGADLGSALKNVGVAVLFICSGGRLDPHPMANTTLGLARQALGNGCTTVIASPWPIDSRIPSYWLPTFLKAWDAGVPVIDAAFDANARVRDAFSSELRDCMAMSVYGDPLRTREQ